MAKLITTTLFFFSTLTLCCSGTLVGFSYDARTNTLSSSLTETVTFLKKNMVAPSQIRVFVSESRVLESLCNSGFSLDLYVTENQIKNLQRSKSSAVSWIKNLTSTLLPCFNITSIVVGSESMAENQLYLLLPTLKSLHSALANLKLDHQPKLSTMFSLSFLENLYAVRRVSDMNPIMDFIRKIKSFIVIDTEITGELSLGDHFLRSVIKSATSATTVLPQNDLPVILNFKNSAFPSATEISEFTEKLMTLVNNEVQIKSRILGQGWCMAKTGALECTLQLALDYACGIGGAVQVGPGTCSYPLASSNLSALNTSNPASFNIFGSAPPDLSH